MDPPRPLASRILPPLALALFVASGFVHLAPRWTSALATGRGGNLHVDASLHLWQYGWLAQALEHHRFDFRSDGLTFPSPVDLLSLWEGHLDLLAAAPVVHSLGPVAAANTAALVHLALLAAGTWVLCRALSRDGWAAAVAAVLLVLSPVFLQEFTEGRVEVGAVGCLALALAWGIRWLGGAGPRFLASAALALAAGIAGYLHLGIFTACLLPLLALGALLAGWSDTPGLPRRVLAVRLAAVAAVLALLALLATRFAAQHVGTFRTPLLDPALLQDPAWLGWVEQGRHGALDPWDLVKPSLEVPHAGSGLVLPLAALLSLVGPRRRRTLPWWCGAVGLHLAALGTTWAVGPHTVVGSPYRYLPLVVPFLLRVQFPHRFLMAADLCLAVLVALGLASLGARPASGPARPARRILLHAVPALLLLLLGWIQVSAGWPFRAVQPSHLPPVVALLAAEQPRAVLELSSPGDRMRARGRQPFLYDRFRAALVHGAPLCCADVPRDALAGPGETDRAPVLTWLLRGVGEPDQGPSLEAIGFSHVVVHGAACHEATGPPQRPGAGPPDCGTVMTFLSRRYGSPLATWQLGGDKLAVWRLGGGPGREPW